MLLRLPDILSSLSALLEAIASEAAGAWRWLLARSRRQVATALCILAALHVTMAIGDDSEDFGDHVQNALPVLGAACATVRGDFGEYFGRFAGNMAVVHGLKNGLGAAEINQRPSGSGRGFPSGHTAASIYGASYLVRQCGAVLPYAGPVVALSAGFVAGTRIESGKHDLRQVMAGAIVGLGWDLGFRRRSSRRRLSVAWRRARRWVRLRLRPLQPVT